MSADAKCNCQHCGGHIAFPSEAAGQMIECPHCNLETLLFIPPAAILPKPKDKRTNIILLVIVIFLMPGRDKHSGAPVIVTALDKARVPAA
jgi:hypothetical protein